ncbi:MAG: helix-turn-helix domain-containing protein [Kiritimatiellae bacterium]|nr:helix-turn-helix domain-containing protein [Kiritimatiellia bacterium]
MKTGRLAEKSPVPGLDRGLAVLEQVALGGREPGFNEIVAQLGAPASSVARVLKVLLAREYLVKDPRTGRYRPGPAMAVLGQHVPLLQRLTSEGRPLLRALRDATQNTALLIHWNGRVLQCIAKEMDERSLAMQPEGEIRDDVWNYPWGWFFIWALTPAQRKAVLSRASGERAVLARAETARADFGKCGYVYEATRQWRRFAAPVRDARGECVAALGLGGTPATIGEKAIGRIGRLVAEHAARLSRALGWAAGG